uniref:Protein sidekick n=1 Tax=Cacopsylla melanoneura TaxID=428564 RepID=A0A8D8PYU4_9HEMI
MDFHKLDVSVFNILVILLSILTFTSCDIDKVKPSITVKTRQGEKVFLPCHVAGNVDIKVVKWWKKETLVALSDHSMETNNYHLHENNTLEIRQVTLDDDANYTCEVIRVEPWSRMIQMITVQVLYPPEITTVPESGVVDVEKGKEVTITCQVTGVPKPSIRWYHEEKEIELLYNRESLDLDRITLKLAGLYQCIASNNIGESTSKNFIVNVIYPPESSVERQWIHSAPDMRAEIICNVYANPPAKVEWFRDGTPVKVGGRIDMHVSSEKHTLLIRHVRDTDFGNYMCQTSNLLGSSQQFVQLSGIPNMPIFLKSSRRLCSDSYRLVWQVDTYSSIIQYALKFRERDEDAPWHKIVIPSDGSIPGPIYTQSYNITGLQLFTQYEASVLAKNKFGWSRPSKSYVFATEGADFSTDYDEQRTDDSSYTITDVTSDLVNQGDNEISSRYSKGVSLSVWFNLLSTTTLSILYYLNHVRIT